MVIAQKESLLRFGREQDLKGERGKPTYWCMPIILSLFFSQFPLFSSLFSFLSFFFSFTLFSFYSVNTLFFDLFLRARQGSFYSAYRGQFLPLCPLTAFVWSGRTYRPPKVCDTYPRQTKAGLFHSSVYRIISFLPRYKCFLSLSLKACT